MRASTVTAPRSSGVVSCRGGGRGDREVKRGEDLHSPFQNTVSKSSSVKIKVTV